MKQHRCKTVVVAPGSRNAPLIITFENDPEYRCISVPDERAAAFTAMGMSLEQREPVAVICSSGSATVNFFPAVAEAFYQKLPLVVITADRPKELIDQGVGQTMRQEAVFGKHVVKEANLIRDPQDDLAKAYNLRLINEAMHASPRGPVHINVPFDEPLYDVSEIYTEKARCIKREKARGSFEAKSFASVWNRYDKVMILAGQMPGSGKLEKAVEELDLESPFLVLSETVSNLHVPNAVQSIDRLLASISREDKAELRPDLLITVGGEVVSKMVKKFLKEHPPKEHWHLSPDGELRDTFQFLNGVLEVEETEFFQKISVQATTKNEGYRDYWLRKNQRKQELHEEYLQETEFSDLRAYQTVLKNLPEQSILHTANSASVRYSQLFDHKRSVRHYANRGTSGIDGCTSTAIGHAMTTDRPVTLITGDVAFLYDSNAFWNDELPPNLRVIIMNNNGGNIFRIIKGPDKTDMFERFQETVHQVNLKGVADTFGLDFRSVGDNDQLQESLPAFFGESQKPKILEVRTPRLESPEILAEYFRYLRKE